MQYILPLYFIVLLFTGLISCLLGLYIFRENWINKRMKIARTFILLMIFIAIWCFGAALALFSTNASNTYFWEQFKYVGIVFVPPTWLIFSLQWAGSEKWIAKKKLYLIYIISFIFLIIIFTDNFHHLIWNNIEYQSINSFLITNVTHGTGWWLLFTYSYLLLIIATIYLVKQIFQMKKIYQKQIIILLFGCISPWIANIFYSLNIYFLDFSPTAFFITGLIFTWGFTKFKLINISPIAKNIIFDNMKDPVFIVDKQNRIIDATPVIKKIFNYNTSDIIGKNIYDILKDDDNIRKIDENNLKNTEIKIKSKNIDYFFDIKKTNLYESNSNYIGKIFSLRDITDRKKIEEVLKKSEKIYRTIFENTGTATIIMDKNMVIKLANKVFQNLSGYTKSEIEGNKNWKEFVNKNDNKNMMNFYKLINEDKSIKTPENFNFKFVDKRGNVKYIFLTIDIVPNTENYIASIQDLTEQKLVLNELRDAHELLYTVNKDLERKVKTRTEKIEKLVEQKDDFINQLGHDLKTPLTPIMALLPIIKDKIEDNEDKELLEIVIRNINYMKDLVIKTIDLAKLNTDKIDFNFEKTNLLSEIENVIKNNEILLKNTNINLTNKIQKNINVKADRLRLNELFNNLLINSIKYSHKNGGDIIVDANENKEMITISIKDTGIGMTEKQLTNIFNEFYKADDSRHDLDSTGLGLSICKKIVKKHGGEIWAESQGKGKGSTFYFTIPNDKISDN